jgi:prophage regulatory protein
LSLEFGTPLKTKWSSILTQKHNGRVKLPEDGLVRLSTILQLIPVSKSAWWEGVKSGRYPKPVKLGPRISAWQVRDILNLIERGVVAP